jgi:rSAM/selenodomain-associated transferase 1
MESRPVLAIMVKAPVAGRSKTRLGREIGMVPAAWWARHQLARLARTLPDRRWTTLLAVAPDTALCHNGLPALPRVAQGNGDLGDRMARVFRRFPGPVLIIGADIPGITRAHVAAGFAALGSHEAAIGPAHDGGYWGIGLKPGRRPPALFQGVRWSSEHALADTLATLPASTAFLPTLHDVDTKADLARLSP